MFNLAIEFSFLILFYSHRQIFWTTPEMILIGCKSNAFSWNTQIFCKKNQWNIKKRRRCSGVQSFTPSFANQKSSLRRCAQKVVLTSTSEVDLSTFFASAKVVLLFGLHKIFNKKMQFQTSFFFIFLQISPFLAKIE